MQGQLVALDLRDGSPLLDALVHPGLVPLRTTYEGDFGEPLGDIYYIDTSVHDQAAFATERHDKAIMSSRLQSTSSDGCARELPQDDSTTSNRHVVSAAHAAVVSPRSAAKAAAGSEGHGARGDVHFTGSSKERPYREAGARRETPESLQAGSQAEKVLMCFPRDA